MWASSHLCRGRRLDVPWPSVHTRGTHLCTIKPVGIFAFSGGGRWRRKPSDGASVKITQNFWGRKFSEGLERFFKKKLGKKLSAFWKKRNQKLPLWEMEKEKYALPSCGKTFYWSLFWSFWGQGTFYKKFLAGCGGDPTYKPIRFYKKFLAGCGAAPGKKRKKEAPARGASFYSRDYSSP